MTGRSDLEQLKGLAQLVLDRQLSELRTAADRRAQSQMQIAALERPAAPEGLGEVTAPQVGLRYQLWADRRRAELNTLLARQTAECIEARETARLAFGRNMALRGIAARLPQKTKS